MKLRLIDRILLAIYTFVIFLLSLGLLGVSLRMIPIDRITDWMASLQYDWAFALVTLVVAVIFLLVSLRLLVSGFHKDKPSSSLLKATELGAIRVSLNTLDTLAQKAVRGFSEIKDVKSMILSDQDGVRVQLKVSIMPDVKMPELTQRIQTRVKEYIEELAGISVKEVPVYIDNLAAAPKNRVE